MLQKLFFQPGINKQITPTAAESQWVGGDNVRFRYGVPEKIGGWDQLGADKLTGAVRAVHHFLDSNGVKYAALGSNKILYVYSGGTYYDIHPIKTTFTETSCFTTSSSSATVTITFSSGHGMQPGDIIRTSSVTISGSTFSSSDFDDQRFEVITVPTPTTITITMATTEQSGPIANSGSATIEYYEPVGPSQQVSGRGFGTGLYGGTVSGPATTTLASGINDAVTDIPLTSSASFPTSGEIRIGSEDISYAANDTSTNILSGGAREVNGTTKAAHSGGATVTNISGYMAWGEASSEDFIIDPGLWVFDNYGTKLIALIYNGKCFEWDADAGNATGTRATVISGAPTASRHMIVSTPDRHLVFFGTETTIGTPSTQDDMFIRFSDQEDINTYAPKATNTAGTQRLTGGSRIMGARRGRDAIYIWTDTALFLMRFVGQPFTFTFSQVGTNCGLIGKNANIEVDGNAYWMSENGFFRYTGKLESLLCLVEDYVYENINTNARDLINAGLNNLFGEVSWFYGTNSSDSINRVVTYNYIESSPQRPVWTVGTLPRTAWSDSAVFDKPHACYYGSSDNASYDVQGNTDGSTIYYEQETGTDQVVSGGTVTAVLANIESGDFDITQDAKEGITFRGDGEYLMKIRRFIPDFVSQTGNTQVTLNLKDYSNSSQASSPLGPFTVTSSTTKVDTRARARSVALKIENTGASQNWKLGTFRLDVQADGRR
jgi:hypothetical protein